MVWGRFPRARYPWASGDTGAQPPGQVLPPPVPGGSQVYYAAAENGVYPWAFGGYAGARSPIVGLVGGVVAVPDPAAGLVRLDAWWPDTATLQIVRVHPDGSKHPVRSGYARQVSGTTRRNLATNPGAEVGLNGYLPGAGNPTLIRPSGTAVLGSYFARTVTTDAGGANGIGVPTALTGAATLTLGFSLRLRHRVALRTNVITNPTFRVNATGWTKLASLTAVVNTAAERWELTATAALGNGVIVAYTTSAISVTPGQTWSGSLVVGAPDAGAAMRVKAAIVPYDGGGASMAGTTFGPIVEVAPGTSATVAVHGHVVPAGAASVRLILYAADGVGVPTGAILYMGRALLEQASAAGTYFDGATAPTDTHVYAWTGAADASTSTDATLGAPADAWRPTSITIGISWADAVGAALTPTSLVLSADELRAAVGQWSRAVRLVTPPTGAVTPTLSITAAGMPVGSSMDLDAVTIEQAVTDGSAFDGASLGAAWTGTAGLSTSVQAPVQTILDTECPLDVLVTYIVAAPGLTGGRVTSGAIVLASNGRTWLTHPQRSEAPMIVDLRVSPTLQHGLDQGVFWPMNARVPIVVTALRRQAPTGTVDFNVNGFAGRDALRSLLDDGSPVLLRAPGDYGYGPGMWLALGDLTEDREGRRAWIDALKMSAPFYEVGAPTDEVT